MSRQRFGSLFQLLLRSLAVFALAVLVPLLARGAPVASMSTWDAANFRIWGYIPYWDYQQVSGYGHAVYDHVSDVLFFGAIRADSTGAVTNSYPVTTSTLRSQVATYGFNLHFSMMAVSGSDGVTATWTNIVNSSAARSKFVGDVKSLMDGASGTADDFKGINLDWERPNSAALWGNYTQLARQLHDALSPSGQEVSVCDYGYPDTSWDAATLNGATAYDQLFIMGYDYSASYNTTFANQHNNIDTTKLGTNFTDDQIALGVGTWGANGPTTVSLKAIVAASPNLAYDALSYTGTVKDLNGNNVTGTWTIESRKQVREKTQLALDRGMPGMFTWTIGYDAQNDMSLHRVMHHYVAVKTNTPDLDLNGKVDATDANTLANNMGISMTNTGMASAAQFDLFYLNHNWEYGDHDGNGFVNQADADWLAGRYNALGITLPDRLAYSGTFETFTNAIGTTGRWKAGRNPQNNLVETGNFKQEAANFLSWNGTGVGAAKRSNSFVTIRNQNSAETSAGVNSLARAMQADLAANIDLNQNHDTYVTFLVKENTGPLSAAQLASTNRILSLDFLNSGGAAQYDFALRGLQQQFAIDSVADSAGQDVSAAGFTSNSTYLFVGKISGNGAGANTLQASLFPSGAVVANFTDPSFQWALTAQGSAGYNPVITAVRFSSQSVADYTVSNIWIGSAATILPPTLASQGDFNHDGRVDAADYVEWRKMMGQTGSNLTADGNGNYQIDMGDLSVWRSYFGQIVSGSGAAWIDGEYVPEPSSCLLLIGCLIILVMNRLARLR